ncbi:hypothetical protein [Streptomyces collinus]|uniref:hypothetical protein n=1 Tax=Streptomyces collinus TaxID=42684 RepID=UPI0033C12079
MDQTDVAPPSAPGSGDFFGGREGGERVLVRGQEKAEVLFLAVGVERGNSYRSRKVS